MNKATLVAVLGEHHVALVGEGDRYYWICGCGDRSGLLAKRGNLMAPADAHVAEAILTALSDDLNTPCDHVNSPVTCIPCLNDAVDETAVLAELEEGL